MQKDDVIYRQAAVDAARKCSVKEVTPDYMLIDKAEIMTELMMLLPAQSEEAIPVSWIEAKIERFKAEDNTFCGPTANIMHVMLNEWKREQEGETI